MNDVPLCALCGKSPEDIDEYVELAADSSMSPNEFVRIEEGTFDPLSGYFLCTADYIRAGMPTARGQWKATPTNLAALGILPISER